MTPDLLLRVHAPQTFGNLCFMSESTEHNCQASEIKVKLQYCQKRIKKKLHIPNSLWWPVKCCPQPYLLVWASAEILQTQQTPVPLTLLPIFSVHKIFLSLLWTTSFVVSFLKTGRYMQFRKEKSYQWKLQLLFMKSLLFMSSPSSSSSSCLFLFHLLLLLRYITTPGFSYYSHYSCYSL
jgi:hypothetical protein